MQVVAIYCILFGLLRANLTIYFRNDGEILDLQIATKSYLQIAPTSPTTKKYQSHIVAKLQDRRTYHNMPREIRVSENAARHKIPKVGFYLAHGHLRLVNRYLWR